MSEDTPDIPQSAVPINGLAALNEGDKVLVEGRKIPHTVTATQRNRVRLEGPRGGQIVLVECVTPDRPDHEYIHEAGRRYNRIYCVERSDGSTPSEPIGIPFYRTLGTGGFSADFTTAKEI